MSTPSDPGLVRLRTGAEVPGQVVRTVTIALDRLLDTHPMAVVEAVAIARDPAHVPFGQTGRALEEMDLIKHGVMHGVTRDVILACFEGDGDDLRFTSSPYASDPATEAQS